MQAESPLITTIIPTYRRPQLLKRAIQSVLNQTYPHMQVCIYDNASGDETAGVVSKIAEQDSRVKYFCHSVNIGAAANFNYGMKQINTPFFSFLSDDDVIFPSFYEMALNGFVHNPDIGFFSGSVVVMDENGKVLAVPFEQWEREGYFSAPQGMLKIIGPNLPLWTGILFRREVLDSIGFIDLEVGGPVDLDYLLRVASRYPYFVSREPCGLLMSHPQSYSTAGNINAFWPGWQKLTGTIVNDPSIPSGIRIESEKMLRKHIIKGLFGIAMRSLYRLDFLTCNMTVDILRDHFNNPIRASIARNAGLICQVGKPTQILFRVMFDLAKLLLEKSNGKAKSLQIKYGNLAQHLES